MAQVCDLCGTKPLTGNKVSHANNKTKRRWMPNLKRVRIELHGIVKSVRLCTRCIRTGKYSKVV
jgi:large subunit ribosomal protein L28